MENQSNWISVYIYFEMSFEKVITDLIKIIVDDLEKNDFISSFFFIRFWENGSHIRLRILPNNQINRDKIITIVTTNSEAYFLKENQVLLHRIEFSEYKREIDRYGGYKNIKNAERQFELSSRTVLDLISKNYSTWHYSLAISYAIQMHLFFALCLFGSNYDSIGVFFQKIFANWFYYSLKFDENDKVSEDEINKVKLLFENSYSSQKVKINCMITSLLYTNSENHILSRWFSECKVILNSFSNNLDDVEQPHIIYDSFIHMTNNRLGIHLRDEAFIAYLIFTSIDDLSKNLDRGK